MLITMDILKNCSLTAFNTVQIEAFRMLVDISSSEVKAVYTS